MTNAPLDELRDAIKERFRGTLAEFFILDQQDVAYRAYVFFPTEELCAASAVSGVRDKIAAGVREELERLGLANARQVTVAFEFDSDERVKTEYGSYYRRLL